MLRRWQCSAPVRQWWVDAGGEPAAPFVMSDLHDPEVTLWIVSYLSQPFAFIQDYNPHAWPQHHFSDLPPGSRGIDQFIGEPAMIGNGHGSGFIRDHVAGLFAQGVPAVGTDPHPANARAIRAYEKAGFVKLDVRMTPWGECLRMVVHAERAGWPDGNAPAGRRWD